MRGRSSSALGWLCAAFVVAAPPAFGGARIGVYSEGDSGFPDGTAGSFAGIASSPDGGTLYVAGGVDDALVLFARDDVTGRLRGAGLQREGEDGVDGLVVAVAAAVSPDSRFVYTASNGEGGKVAVFERTPGADPLQFREIQVEGVAGVTGLSGARALAVTPDGGQLLVAGFDHVVAFARAADGTLDFVESEPIGGGTIRGSPDCGAGFRVSTPRGRTLRDGRPSRVRAQAWRSDVRCTMRDAKGGPWMFELARTAVLIGVSIFPAAIAAAEISEASLRAADAEQMRIIVDSDAEAQQRFMHPNYIINGPSNKVLRKDVLVTMLAEGKMASESFERTIEGLAITGNVGVVMGREVVRPAASSQLGTLHGDKALNRRFTNVFLFEDGEWRFLARQATLVD